MVKKNETDMLPHWQKYKIVLASGSPRRKELLAALNVDFEVRVLPGIDESYPDSLPVSDIPGYIARRKAEAYFPGLADDELLITADTIVSCSGKVLGSPTDTTEPLPCSGNFPAGHTKY
jgi:septum formation protein